MTERAGAERMAIPAVRWSLWRAPFLYWGTLLTIAGVVTYLAGVGLSIVRLVLQLGPEWKHANELLIWYSGGPTTVGLLLVSLDMFWLLPRKRRARRTVETRDAGGPLTVALTAYNDEDSIAASVADFLAHPTVRRVIVVSNNSTDATVARAQAAGAVVVDERQQGYGRCVYRCFTEALEHEDTTHVVLCEGDGTFRAADLNKFLAYLPHAEIVNGTRIVEQLREYSTQLSTFMYYGNFFVGKLLEIKHFGQGTFTDVGTTYKVVSRRALTELLPRLDPSVNLEFNAHFLDRALQQGISIVECPITFHPRVGVSKGGNVNNRRALRVGLRMMLGLSFGWRWVR